MQVFVAFNLSDRETVRDRIETYYGNNNFYDAGHNCFFIATQGETTRQLASKIGLGDNDVSKGIVIPVTSYWGRYSANLWEWISVKQASDGG